MNLELLDLKHSVNFQVHEGRINQNSVLLEGSHCHSNGVRIHQDLTQLKDHKVPYCSLFPGQIVAVEGMNISGRKMVPCRIVCGATLDAIKTKASELTRLCIFPLWIERWLLEAAGGDDVELEHVTQDRVSNQTNLRGLLDTWIS